MTTRQTDQSRSTAKEIISSTVKAQEKPWEACQMSSLQSRTNTYFLTLPCILSRAAHSHSFPGFICVVTWYFARCSIIIWLWKSQVLYKVRPIMLTNCNALTDKECKEVQSFVQAFMTQLWPQPGALRGASSLLCSLLFYTDRTPTYLERALLGQQSQASDNFRNLYFTTGVVRNNWQNYTISPLPWHYSTAFLHPHFTLWGENSLELPHLVRNQQGRHRATSHRFQCVHCGSEVPRTR